MNRKEAILKRSIELKRRVRAIKFVLSFGAVIFSILAVLIVLNVPALRLSRVTVDGTRTVSEEEISRAVLEVLRGSYIYLVPHSNVFFYPRERVRITTQAVSPRIKDVRLRAYGYKTLVVQVKERTPVALWCTSGMGSTTPTCVLLDDWGFAFSIAPYTNGSAYLLFSTSHTKPVIGSSIMEEGAFAALHTFARSFPIHIVSVVVDAERYTLKTREGYDILVNPRIPFDVTRRSVLAALESEALTPSARSGKVLQYLDVRVLGKVFYKLD